MNWRAEDGLHQPDDLAGLREAPRLGLAKEQFVVEADLETATIAGAQIDLNHDGRPVPENLGRQTDGTVQVVSGNAVLDDDAVFGIDHGLFSVAGGEALLRWRARRKRAVAADTP